MMLPEHKQILVVDDEPNLRRVLSAQLQRDGYDVHTSEDGEQALEVLENDIETPEIEGWDYHLFRKRYWGGYHIPRHFYLFNRATLTRLLREEGFEIVSVRSIPSPAFWVSRSNR